MPSGPIVRFAPSPTGRMHIGNARTALLNWLYVRPRGGRFILRFDDTDLERSKLEYAEAIEKDLAWLGIAPDLMRRQSERMAAYDAAAERLKAQGRLYPAYETAEELDRRRRRQQALGRPPIYDRAALRLSDAERAALEASGPGRTGAFASSRGPCGGTTWCAAKVASIANRSPIRCCGARTGATSIRCRRWSTTSTLG
jgi:glutamyl-tRNA synthetase